ncbi:hypothetical protein BDW02DRAFT_70246 [Decorospora gaudefroyi]|uniref:Uncharacterized protein n=1 Tax=Decorospora gaudefroyi TaxID=184978 RepID=A0A6A5K2V6_9PLEO|nr:hypothetical protein BDW02DRAFT_70246 [Decorospora gaudefroyi]
MKPFPVHLFKDQATLESVLVHNSCMEAMVFLHKFAIEFLGDISSKPREVSVRMKAPRLRICFKSTHVPEIGTPDSIYHNIYLVGLNDDEIWAIDPTGAQFGYYEPLCSWGTFQERISDVQRVEEFGYIRDKVFYDHASYPVKLLISLQAEKDDLVKKVEDWLDAWATLHGRELKPRPAARARRNFRVHQA